MRKLLAQISLALVATSLNQASGIVYAGDCKACEKTASDLATQQKLLSENTEFLGKNRQYLAVLTAKEASKFIKVSGNIEMILNRIDANRERIKQLTTDMQKEGCDACPKK